MRAPLLALGVLSLLGGHGAVCADESAGVLVERVDFEVDIELEGVVEPADVIAVRSPADRQVSLIHIAEQGRYVKAGDRVARLDESGLLEDREKQRIEMEFAERRLVGARVERELAQLRRVRGERALEARALELGGERRLAEQQIARAKKSEGDVVSAELRMAVAKAKTEILELDRRILAMETERDRAAADGNLKRAKDELARERRSYEHLGEQIAGCELRAPRDGMVLYVGRPGEEAQPGDPIRPRQAVLEIVDPRSLRARLEVPEADVGAVQRGQAVMLRTASDERTTIAGIVQSVGRLPISRWIGRRDAGTRYAVLVAIPEAHDRLRIGLRLRARILVKRLIAVLVVPNTAIRRDGNRVQCIVVTPSGTERREVQLGPSGPTHTVVVEGLSEGERVAP